MLLTLAYDSTSYYCVILIISWSRREAKGLLMMLRRGGEVGMGGGVAAAAAPLPQEGIGIVCCHLQDLRRLQPTTDH